MGTCSRTWGVPGDCERGALGTWRVGGDDLISIDDCTARCQRCARCAWISFSHAHQQCDWYRACNTSKLNRRFGGETFRTRLVKPELAAQEVAGGPPSKLNTSRPGRRRGSG